MKKVILILAVIIGMMVPAAVYASQTIIETSDGAITEQVTRELKKDNHEYKQEFWLNSSENGHSYKPQLWL